MCSALRSDGSSVHLEWPSAGRESGDLRDGLECRNFRAWEIVAAGGVFTLSIVVLIAGAFIGEVWIKTLFVLAVTVASGGVAWRWLLVRSERAWIIGYLPAGFGPALERFAN